MSAFTYRDLQVWQKSIAFVTRCYRLTADFPKYEMYGLTSQLRRSAVSIPSNISEGHGRSTTRDYLRFLAIAYGSLCEVETQITIARELSFLAGEETESLLSDACEIGRMLNALIASLERKLEPHPP